MRGLKILSTGRNKTRKLRTGKNKVGFFCGPLHLAGSGLQQLCLIFVCGA